MHVSRDTGARQSPAILLVPSLDSNHLPFRRRWGRRQSRSPMDSPATDVIQIGPLRRMLHAGIAVGIQFGYAGGPLVGVRVLCSEKPIEFVWIVVKRGAHAHRFTRIVL